MKPLETPQLGYRAHIAVPDTPLPMVKSVDILGKVVQRPRYDVRSNPIHRSLMQHPQDVKPLSNSSLPARSPLAIHKPLSSKFTSEFTAMYSDNGLTVASLKKKKEEQLLKKQHLFQKAQEPEEIQEVEDDFPNRFERLHQERQDLFLKMHKAALTIQTAFRGHSARLLRLKLEKERQLKERLILRKKLEEMRETVVGCLMGVENNLAKKATIIQAWVRRLLARKRREKARRCFEFVERISGIFLYQVGTCFYDILEMPPRQQFFVTGAGGQANRTNTLQTPSSEFDYVTGQRIHSQITEVDEEEERKTASGAVIILAQQSQEKSLQILGEESSSHLIDADLSGSFKVKRLERKPQVYFEPLQQTSNFASISEMQQEFPSPSHLPSIMQDISPIKPEQPTQVQSSAASMMAIFNPPPLEQRESPYIVAPGTSRTPCEKSKKPIVVEKRVLQRQNSSPEKVLFKEKHLRNEGLQKQRSKFLKPQPKRDVKEQNADLKEPYISPHKKSFSQPQQVTQSKPKLKVEVEEKKKSILPPPAPRALSTRRPKRSEIPMSVSSTVPSTTSGVQIPPSVLSQKMAILSQGGSSNAPPKRVRPQTGKIGSTGSDFIKRGKSAARLKRIKSARRDVAYINRTCDGCRALRNGSFSHIPNVDNRTASCTTLEVAATHDALSSNPSAAGLQNVKSHKSMGTVRTSASTVTARLYGTRKCPTERRLCSARSGGSLLKNYSRAALLLSGRNFSGQKLAEDLDPELQAKIASLNEKALGSGPNSTTVSYDSLTRFQRHSFFQSQARMKDYNSAKSAASFIQNPFHNEHEGLQLPPHLLSDSNPLTPGESVGAPESPHIIEVKTPQISSQRVSRNFKDIFPELSSLVQKYAPPKPKHSPRPANSKKGWIVM